VPIPVAKFGTKIDANNKYQQAFKGTMARMLSALEDQIHITYIASSNRRSGSSSGNADTAVKVDFEVRGSDLVANNAVATLADTGAPSLFAATFNVVAAQTGTDMTGLSVTASSVAVTAAPQRARAPTFAPTSAPTVDTTSSSTSSSSSDSSAVGAAIGATLAGLLFVIAVFFGVSYVYRESWGKFIWEPILGPSDAQPKEVVLAEVDIVIPSSTQTVVFADMAAMPFEPPSSVACVNSMALEKDDYTAPPSTAPPTEKSPLPQIRGLSPHLNLDEFHQMFARYDFDQSGTINSIEEFKQLTTHVIFSLIKKDAITNSAEQECDRAANAVNLGQYGFSATGYLEWFRDNVQPHLIFTDDQVGAGIGF